MYINISTHTHTYTNSSLSSFSIKSLSLKMVKGSQKIVAVDKGIPIIDMSQERSRVSMQIVKACETLGFFKVVNHGFDRTIISRMEQESINFFSKPVHEKKSVESVNQAFRYGFRDIGLNGDSGEVEYLLFHTNDPAFRSKPSIRYVYCNLIYKLYGSRVFFFCNLGLRFKSSNLK